MGLVSRCDSAFDPMPPALCRSVAVGVGYAVAAGNARTGLDHHNLVPAADMVWAVMWRAVSRKPGRAVLVLSAAHATWRAS